MTLTALETSRVWFVRSALVLALIASALSARAAQEIFWPSNLFPPPSWSLTYTNASTISVTVPTVGPITTRNVRLSGFSNPLALPALNDTALYNNASSTFESESSLDSGANWAPYAGSGAATLTLRHTNDSPGVRRFEAELSTQLIPVNGAYGAAAVRESPTLASVGELVVTATNGGFHYRGYLNVHWEVSVDNGGTWFAMSPAAYMEWSGPAGTPVVLSVTRSTTTLSICWPTETGREYQLQKTTALDGTDWVDVDGPQTGTGAEVCMIEFLSSGPNQFYRVQVVP